MMTDHPLTFSAPAIRALLDGRKTQTRRRLKVPNKTHNGGVIYERKDMGGWAATTVGGAGCFTVSCDGSRHPAPERAAIWHQTTGVVVVPPIAIGDRLWVREAHALVPATAYRMSTGVEQEINPADRAIACVYRLGWERSAPRWRPSIHMPRWASRLTLTVTEVRVTRLQDISEADAKAEGDEAIGAEICPPEVEDIRSYVWGFRNLWNSLHGPGAWDANPWVAAYSFTVQRRNIDSLPKGGA